MFPAYTQRQSSTSAVSTLIWHLDKKIHMVIDEINVVTCLLHKLIIIALAREKLYLHQRQSLRQDQTIRVKRKGVIGANTKNRDPDQPATLDDLILDQWIFTRTAKAQIRLRGCAVWSGPTLCAYTPKAPLPMMQLKWTHNQKGHTFLFFFFVVVFIYLFIFFFCCCRNGKHIYEAC